MDTRKEMKQNEKLSERKSQKLIKKEEFMSTKLDSIIEMTTLMVIDS